MDTSEYRPEEYELEDGHIKVTSDSPGSESFSQDTQPTALNLEIEHFRGRFDANWSNYKTLMAARGLVEARGQTPTPEINAGIAEMRTRLLGGAAIIAVLDPKIVSSLD